MGIKLIVLAATTLVLSTSVNAAIVTQGYLTTYDDGSSNIIEDSLNNVEYLRLDVLADLTYAQTLAVLDTQDGGGWSIATATDAMSFIDALFGPVTPTCAHDGTSPTSINCGALSSWYFGKLGDSYHRGSGTADLVWFMDDAGQVDYISIPPPGPAVGIYDLGTIASSDMYSAEDRFLFDRTVGWLVVRPSAVPIPSALWLFGSGLIGLIGLARRKGNA